VPPGCSASHSQCLGNSVTSRATTPILGRPAGRRPFPCTRGKRLTRRAKTSSLDPRKSKSIGLPVVSSKTSTHASACLLTCPLTARATSKYAPDANCRVWSNAVHDGAAAVFCLVCMSQFTRIKYTRQYIRVKFLVLPRVRHVTVRYHARQLAHVGSLICRSDRVRNLGATDAPED